MLLFRILTLLFLFSSIAKAETKSVGVILPLSGGGASYGVACKNGIELGLKDFKDKIGDKFKVIFEDDQNTSSQTLSALRKLRNSNRSDIFLTFSSSTSNAISPLADKENFLLFALATDPNVVKERKNAFNYWVTPDEEVKLLIAELLKRNIKHIAIFTTQHEGTFAFKKTLEEYLVNTGIEVIFEDEFSPNDRDFRTSLTKLSKVKNLGGIFNNLYIDQVGLLPKQARDLGIKVPVFSWELYENAAVIEAAQGALEGQFFVTAPVGIKEFEIRYKEMFPQESVITAANCYDYVGLLAAAPDISVAGFRSYLETLKDYPGAVGKSSATGDHRFTLPANSGNLSNISKIA